MSTLKVNNIRHNSATSDAITTAADGTCTAKLTNYPHRNLFLNGAVNISQRGDSYASAYSYKADQWYIFPTGSTTTRLTTSPPDGFTYYFRCPSATASILFTQQIELEAQGKVGRYKGKTVTVSWYARSESSNTMYVDAAFKNASGGGDYTAIVSGSGSAQSITSSWARYSQTFTISATPHANNKCFSVMIRTPSGQGGTLEATGFQCEFGDTMTDFEHISIAEDLSRCQRYFQVLSRNTSAGLNAHSRYPALGNGTNSTLWYCYHKQTMRVKPSLITSNITSTTVEIFNYSTSGGATYGGSSMAEGDENHSQITVTTTGGVSTGQIACWRFSNNADCYWAVSAEI